MCRWIAYLGSPILLSKLLTQPDHSLIDQSVRTSPNSRRTFDRASSWRTSGRRRERPSRTPTVIHSRGGTGCSSTTDGSVPQFASLKRELLLDVEPGLFPSIDGSTDSEILFFLALTFGLHADPKAALERTIERVEHALEEAGIRAGTSTRFDRCTARMTRYRAMRWSSCPSRSTSWSITGMRCPNRPSSRSTAV